MTEDDFWLALEFRLSNDLRHHPTGRGMWCDGILPVAVDRLNGRTWRVIGKLWTGKSGQEVWQFAARLHTPAAQCNDIDWQALLPPTGDTNWFDLDVAAREVWFELNQPNPVSRSPLKAPRSVPGVRCP
jgi:hypothetical protein